MIGNILCENSAEHQNEDFLFYCKLSNLFHLPHTPEQIIDGRAVQKHTQNYLQKYSLSHQCFDYKHNFIKYTKRKEKKENHKKSSITNCIIRAALHMGTAQMP